MEMILFVGGQGAGKSTFYRERFFSTHVRLSLDMLKTRHREQLLVGACLQAKQPFVVDNTNPTVQDRKRYFELAQGSRFRVVAYYFEASVEELLQRNAKRKAHEVVPEIGVRGTHKRLVPPAAAEGFDEMFRVRALPGGGFEVVKMENGEDGK